VAPTTRLVTDLPTKGQYVNHNTRPTVPAPAHITHESEAVAAYIRASERVRQALLEQREAIQALKTFDSRHPEVAL